MPPPDPERLALWRSLAVSHSVVAQELDRLLQEERGTPLPWFEVLDAVVNAGGRVNAGDLAVALGAVPSSLTRRLDRMEEEELIRRERGVGDDGRYVQVVITRDGRERYRRCFTTWRRVLQRRFAGHLTETDVVALQRVFSKVLSG